MYGPLQSWNDFLSLISIAPAAKKRRKPRGHRFEALELREMLASAQVGVSADSGTLDDGQVGHFIVSMNAVLTNNVDVTYHMSGAAVQGTDYTATPSGTTGTLTIAASQTTVSVTILDSCSTGTRDIQMNLDGVSEPIGSDNVALETNGAVADISLLSSPEPAITISDAAASEKSGTMTFAVFLSPPSGANVTVPFATAGNDGTDPGDDYEATSGTLTFSAGTTLQFIDVAVTDDPADDPPANLASTNENTPANQKQEQPTTFTVNLSQPSNAALARAVGTGTIYDGAVPNNQAQNCFCQCSCPGSELNQVSANGAGNVKVTTGDAAAGANSSQPTQLDFARQYAPEALLNVQDLLSPGVVTTSGVAVATDIEVQVTFGPTTAQPVYYSASGYTAGETVDFAENVSIPSTFTAGQYPWTMNVIEQYANADFDVTRSYNGTYNVQNLDGSPFGTGWMLGSLDRLYPASNGVELAGGDGNLYWFEPNGNGSYLSPADSPNFSTLTATTSNSVVTYTLTDAQNNVEVFNQSGELTKTLDNNGNQNTYVYDGSGRVSTITDQASRSMTFSYGATSTTVTDIEGRTTTYNLDSSNHLISVVDPSPGDGEPQLTVSYTYTNGNIATIADADGTTSLFYDAFNALTRVVDPEGRVTAYSAPEDQELPTTGTGATSSPYGLVFDSQIEGKEVDGNTHTMTYSTGPYGEISESTDAEGASTSTTYNAAGEPLEISGPELTSGPDASQPNLTIFQYDQNGNVTLEHLPTGATEQWSYDTHWNEVTQFIDPQGRVTDFSLDPNTGNALSMTEVGNGSPDRVTSYTFTPKPTGQGQTPGGLLATETDPRGIENEYFYNTRGMLTEMVEAANSTAPATLTFGYDSHDDLTYSTNEVGAATTYHVDALGRTIETDLPAIAAGQPITYDAYDALNRLASETQLQSVSGTTTAELITRYTYEPGGDDSADPETITEIGQSGTNTTTYSVTTFSYDNADNVTKSVDGMGYVTAYQFDADNRQVAEQDPDPAAGTSNNMAFTASTANGPVTRVDYDPLGNVVTQYDPNYNGQSWDTTQNAYDLDGDLLSTTGPAPTSGAARPVTAFSYDYDDEQLTETSPNGGVTYFTYDSFGELVDERAPSPDGKQLGPLTVFQYDPDGNLVAETSPNGATTQFIFNARNEMVEQIDPSPDGTAPGPTTQWMYDLAGQVTQMVDAASRVTEYEFDPDGNLTATIAPNLASGGAGDASTTTSDAFDLAGDKISETTPTPNGATLSATTFWQYNPLGEVTEETDPTPASGGTAPVWQYDYNADEQVTKTIDPLNRAETTVLDGLGRPESQVDDTGVTSDWSYDNMSNVLGETVGAGTSLAQTTTNAYNALDELVSTTAPNAGVTSFKYDLDGNRTSLVDSDQNTSSWSYDLLDRMTSETTPNGTGTATATYVYDADSNLVQTVDADGRVIDYQFDALDRQTGETWQQVAVSTATAGSGGHTDTAWSLVLPTDATGGTWTVTAKGQTTGDINADAPAAAVQAAIAALSGIGQGGVSVAGQGTPFNPFVVTFTGALAATSVSLTANYSGISTGSGSQPGTTTQTSWGGPGTDEQEVVGYAATGDYGVTGGEFDLTYNAQTTAVAYDATPAQVKSALGNMGLTNIEVTGPSGSGIGATGAAIFTITFVGALGGQYLAQPVGISEDPTSPLTDSQGSTADIALESAITLGGADEVDDVQQVIVTQTSGTFALGYGGNSTPAQTVGETAAKLQTALEGLPGLAQATVTGSGTAASPYLVTFGGDLKGENVPLLGGGNAVNTIDTAYNADGSISSIGDNYSHYAYTYDGEGNTATVDNAGTPNVPDVVLSSSFDAAGNRASLSATIGGTKDFVNTYEYDALSRVTQIEQTGVTNGNTVAYKELDYTFDPLGDVTSRAAYSTSNTPRSDAATGQYGYNTLGQLTSLHFTSNSGATAIDDLGWSFDSLGRVSTFSSIDGTATYGYDSVNEVTSASYSTSSGGHQPTNESYSFDANGNRPAENDSTTINNEVADDGTYHYTFDAAGNRLTETPDTGAPSSDHPASFTYDYRNRLVEVQEFNNATPPTLTEQINYTYDVNDDLIERVDDLIGGSTTTTHYVWDQFSPLPSGEGQGGGGIVLAFNGNKQLTARYLNGPNTSAYDQYFTTLAEEDLGTGKVTFDLPDELGTVRDVVDSSGQPVDHLNYNAFGVQVYASAPTVTPLDGYAGGFYDPSTGLVYFINRWYDPTATVWISADPIGFVAGDTNLTRYVGNNGVNVIDPFGLEGEEWVGENPDAWGWNENYHVDPVLEPDPESVAAANRARDWRWLAPKINTMTATQLYLAWEAGQLPSRVVFNQDSICTKELMRSAFVGALREETVDKVDRLRGPGYQNTDDYTVIVGRGPFDPKKVAVGPLKGISANVEHLIGAVVNGIKLSRNLLL